MNRSLRKLAQALLVAGCMFASAQTAMPPDGSVTPPEHRRGAEQTFLTFPEWFLVFSPAELADYMQQHTPDDFPFFGHIHQFWSSYSRIRSSLREGHYPFNFGYHVMIVVIGVSTSVEYSLKSLYETLVGRLTALGLDGDATQEDRYAAAVQQDYVEFIRVTPWYEYGFAGKLKHLWTDTDLWGRHPLRKWERKYALTTEYSIKAVYGWLIGKATQSAYDAPIPVTAVQVEHLPDGVTGELPELKMLQSLADGSQLVTVPRYDAFTHYAHVLASHGAQFREIAGNRGVILVSALVPSGWTPDGLDQYLLFSQPVLTRPAERRLVLAVPVSRLAGLLTQFDTPGIRLEHVFDY